MIDEWWGWSFPRAAVAIATGSESGIWVLDLDVKDGVNGVGDWADLVAEHGPIASTFTAMTRSGGSHVYFAWDDDTMIRNSAKRVAPGIDVRGEGGYVRAFTRLGDVISSVLPVTAPAWLVDLAVKAALPDKARSGGGTRPAEARRGGWTERRT